MGRKKKKQSRPWCWYCNREFDDEKILIQHQKAKHFKCHICHKKLYTGPGLSIHCMQVHKETIDKVPNSLPNRSNIEIEIYGMEGIPPEDMKEHEKQRNGRPGSPSSGEDEPAPKKSKPEGLLGSAPGSMVPHGMPGMPMGQFPPSMHPMMGHMGHFGPGMMPGMHMPPGMPPVSAASMPPRPLFPSASIASTAASAPLGADFKPITSMAGSMGSIRPTFPAYSSTNNGSITTSTLSDSKVNMIATTSATSKIIHPPEDLSLEEIRARLPNSAMLMAPLMRPTMTLATPALIHGGNMMRPPPMGLPPGMIGAAGLPPGAMHPAFAAQMGFPGAPMLAPMMHPRFR
ncbi:hypothetical protein QAD02_016309 [Eretmocerus hayati]|uniref:Uncharacterized protein n=1 Tax=Eretmocerus hayati TaxID=131215 RepID=A0ACC2PAQ8_9HYME|nr:hypothetical protein QAD02_016309 [Eretmocerus hayati]